MAAFAEVSLVVRVSLNSPVWLFMVCNIVVKAVLGRVEPLYPESKLTKAMGTLFVKLGWLVLTSGMDATKGCTIAKA